MNDVYVRLDDLPETVKGYVSLDPEGDYNVYINKDLCQEQQMRVLAHEVLHIDNGHLRVLFPAVLWENSIV